MSARRLAIAVPQRTRRTIEDEIERLIALLDAVDGDPDLEPEIDTGADERGEIEGETFLEMAA